MIVSLKQKKIIFKPRIKLNHNMYIYLNMMKFERSSSLEYYHIPHIGKTKDTCERGLFLYKERVKF